MNNVIKTILLTLIGTLCFGTGIYYAVSKFEKQVSKWDSTYKSISEKVYAFEKVSDPKTIRLYVNELNKILDDIDFIHTLIESGQLADEALEGMFDNQKNLGSKVDSLYSEISLMVNSIKDYNIAQDVADERNLNSVKLLINENVDKQKQYIEDLNNQITELHIKLNEVNKVIDRIKNSKLSKYLK